MNGTRLFNIEELEDAYLEKILKEVYNALEERGYNPINQLVGYLVSGDTGYISSYKDSRKKIMSLDRAKIMETLLKNYLK